MNLKEADRWLRKAGIPMPATQVRRLEGGTHPAWCISTNSDAVFLKQAAGPDAAAIFKAEEEGLRVLRIYAHDFHIPEVVLVTDEVLMLEYIAPGQRTATSEAFAGAALANMHLTARSEFFGWAFDNFIGKLRQVNDTSDDWLTFFRESRIRPMLKTAIMHLSDDDCQSILDVISRAGAKLPAVRPSLVHGDLWSGNLFYDGDGRPVLIDPSIHYGNPEADIAMTTMFGGFGEAFYTAWGSAYRPDEDLETRLELWKLYPLLVHVNLFGTAYVRELRHALGQLRAAFA